MSFRREGDRVFLALTYDDWEILLLMLGYAIGAVSRSQSQAKAGAPLLLSWLALVNRLTDGNLNFTPYKVDND